MRVSMFFCISMILFHLGGICQSCLPEGIVFKNQLEVDSFQFNYPGCSEIEGSVSIYANSSGIGISNLNGLSVLTYIGGDFNIYSTDSLHNLSGIGSLTTIDGSFNVWDNEALVLRYNSNIFN